MVVILVLVIMVAMPVMAMDWDGHTAMDCSAKEMVFYLLKKINKITIKSLN